MKIFANLFCLELLHFPNEMNFSFEKTDLNLAMDVLQNGQTRFPGQVFYCVPPRGAEAFQKLFDFHSAPAIGEVRATISLLFSTEKELLEFFQEYSGRFKLMEAAGGGVVNKEGELLLIFRIGHWDLPKGKVEKGEGIEEAAWREVAEETGLRHHRIVSDLGRSFHIFPQKGKIVLKTTHWFEMESTEEERPIPQVEEDILEVVWQPLAQLRLNPPDTWPLIQEVIRKVKGK